MLAVGIRVNVVKNNSFADFADVENRPMESTRAMDAKVPVCSVLAF